MGIRTGGATLALLGGAAAASDLKRPVWPPRSPATAARLAALYEEGTWSFDLGGQETAFVNAFAAHHSAKRGVFVFNGTVALQIALQALDVGPGDEVIVPALTWPATALAVAYLGATPVFVDVERDTMCLDPIATRAALTARTRAIIAVHLYGSMADLENLGAIAKKAGIPLIEDAAQVSGGRWDGVGVGSLGAIGCFSFQQTKVLTSGEGGICITSDDALADRMYQIKHIGYRPGEPMGKYTSHPDVGLVHNFRGTEFQALILHDQLQQLPARLARYEAAASRVAGSLSDVAGIRLQARGRLADLQSYFRLAISFDSEPMARIPRHVLLTALQAEGVPVLPAYPLVFDHILWTVPRSSYRIARDACPVAEASSARTVLLPHEWLDSDNETIDRISLAVRKVAENADALADVGA